MTIKDILENFSRKEELHRQKMQEDEAKTRQEIERRIQDISQYFEAVILPAVYSVENDLQQGGSGTGSPSVSLEPLNLQAPGFGK